MTDKAAHIHIDHVGSLLRPQALRDARQRLLGVHDATTNLGAHDNAELRAIEDGHVRDVVKLQEGAGLPCVTDGEFRRRSWWTDFYLSLTGTGVTYNGTLSTHFVNAKGEKRPSPGTLVNGKVAWRGSVNVEPFKFLKSVAARAPKVSIPAPPMLHFMRGENFVPAVYRTMDAFWADMTAAYKAEIKALAEAGCRHIQIDECMLAWLCDPRHRANVKARGDDPDKLVEAYARSISDAIEGRPKDMIVAMHMCRGNLNAFWGGEGGYEPVADIVFNAIDADYFLLEYDTPRAGDFRPLRHMPKGKKALLGLVSTKEAALESVDALRRRIDEAATHLGHAQLGLCPQCGFSTNMFGTHFTEDDERQKLARIAEVGAKVWG